MLDRKSMAKTSENNHEIPELITLKEACELLKVHPNTLKNLKPGAALVFAPGHEDSLVRTARVFKLINGKIPELEAVAAVAEPGLDLAAAVKPAQKKSAFDDDGVLVAPQKSGKSNQTGAGA